MNCQQMFSCIFLSSVKCRKTSKEGTCNCKTETWKNSENSPQWQTSLVRDVGTVAEDLSVNEEKGFCESRSERNVDSNLYFVL